MEVGEGVWVVGGEVGFVVGAEVGVAADAFASALAFPVNDAAGVSLLLAHLDGLADGSLELGVVGDLVASGVGVVEQDDGSGAFGEVFERGDEFSHRSGVSGDAFADGSVERVDDDYSVAALFDEEVLDGFESVGCVDGVGFDVEIEVGGFVDVGVAVDGGEDFAGRVVEADVADGLLV